MSRLRFDDDIFSPVRLDASTIDESSDCSEGSLNSFSNAGDFSLTDVQNKITLEKSFTKSSQENECSKESESMILSKKASPPVLSKKASDKSNAKRHSSKLKLEKIKDQNIGTIKKQNDISQQKTQESLNREIILDSHTAKPDASNKLPQKKSKSASLLSKDDSAKTDSLKVTKIRQKGDGRSSKCYVKEGHKSNYDQLVEKISTGSSSNLLENISDTNFKDSSAVSSESKESIHSNSSVNKKLVDGMPQQNEKLTVNPFHTSYEASIKKMISNSISSESMKIHQLIYMQQMSFYREMDKIKGKLEEQHLITTERLFKVIEELMQMNASLRLALSSKNE